MGEVGRGRDFQLVADLEYRCLRENFYQVFKKFNKKSPMKSFERSGKTAIL